jgi:hypothetical protein
MKRRAFLAALAAAPIAAIAVHRAAPFNAERFFVLAGRRGGKTTAAMASVNPKNIYGRVTFTSEQIQASRHQSGAFAEAWRAELAGMATLMQRDEERAILGLDL